MIVKTTFPLLLLTIVRGNYTINHIEGNIYIGEESKIHLYHETWRLIVGINMTNNRERISAIDKTISIVEQACIKKCLPQYEIELIRKRYNRLISQNYILTKLLRKQRNKRGLANFVGDISKTLFGTLNEGDIAQINSQFDNLYRDNKNIASILTNHTKINTRNG